MSKFFDPKLTGETTEDKRRHAPATARNRDSILDVLRRHILGSGTVLELASGTGEHACHFAAGLPNVTWQPSDIDDSHLDSIRAWRDHLAVPAVQDPIYLDATKDWPQIADLIAVTAINLIHISPWMVAQQLIKRAGDALPSKGVLYLYGPYKRGGQHTSESNHQFDANLKASNPSWGVRDMEAVIELAQEAGFQAPDIIPMPANNFSLIFKKP